MPSRRSNKATVSSNSTDSDNTVGDIKVHSSSLPNPAVSGDARHLDKSGRCIQSGHGANAPHDPLNSGDDSLNNLGNVLRQILSRLKELEQVGIESSSIPLPKIALLGDQSSGKSSLVEAITEIEVPRASGTCTRCPIMISTTEEAEAWSCTIKIHKKFDFLGKWRASDADELLGPWLQKDVPEDTYSRTIFTKNELKKEIERAQVAILNPNVSPDLIMSEEFDPEKNKVSFSPNLIKLEIKGPGLPTLQVYDLPGIVTQFDSEDDPHLPARVRSLAKQYVEDESTIIVLACAIDSDAHTSNAAALISDIKAQHRSLGVLTKADRLQHGDTLDNIRDMLANRKFSLGYGYLSTRQPPTSELKSGINHRKARELELDLFNNQNPWNSELSMFKQQFGTINLQTKLSHLLASLVTARLPSMISAVTGKLDVILGELSHYPKAPDDACLGIVFNLLREFRAKVDRTMAGEYRYNGFTLEWGEHISEWRQTLTDIKPSVWVHLKEPESGWKTASHHPQAPITVDSDEETPSPSTGAKRPLSASPVTTNASGKKRVKTNRMGTPGSARKTHPLSKTWSLDEVLKIQQSVRTSGIPTATDPRADDELISQAMEHWRGPLLDELESVRKQTKAHIEGVLIEVLREWRQTALFEEAHAAVNSHLDKILHTHSNNALRFLDAELLKPTTFDVEELHHRRGVELQTIAARRLERRATTYLDHKEGILGKKTEGAERQKKMTALIKDPKELGTDPMKDQIETVARVRGYYNVAVSGLVNSIAKMQQYEVFHRIQLELGGELENALDICGRDGLEKCKQLLAEDPAREARRAFLEKEKDKLSSAQVLLEEMPKY